MNIVDARLAYILNKLDILEQKLDRIDGTLTGMSIKLYEGEDNGAESVLGCGAGEAGDTSKRRRKSGTSKKDI
jgi:hypothetical protein